MISDVLCSLMKNYTEQVVKWQVTLCDPIWHVSSRSGEAGLTANCYIRILYFTLLYFKVI